MASNAPAASAVSGRLLHKFNLIALDGFKVETMRSMLQTTTDLVVGSSWPSAVHAYSERLVSALLDMSQRVIAHLRPTPMKAHYTFSWRDMQKVICSVQMAEGNSLKKQENVMKLFYHECLRTYGDRLLMSHDQVWFSQNLEAVCREHFDVLEDSEKS
jgi:dynein heavy chain